eukprot:5838774-Pyramimonas_sp.AAC.1
MSGLWAETGVLVKHRDPSEIVVLHVNSHQTAKDVCEKQIPERLGSFEVTKIAEVEGRAALIGRGLLRATLEAAAAEREEAKISAPEPGGRA